MCLEPLCGLQNMGNRGQEHGVTRSWRPALYQALTSYEGLEIFYVNLLGGNIEGNIILVWHDLNSQHCLGWNELHIPFACCSSVEPSSALRALCCRAGTFLPPSSLFLCSCKYLLQQTGSGHSSSLALVILWAFVSDIPPLPLFSRCFTGWTF